MRKISLREADTILSFGLSINRKTEVITVKYSDEFENEIFPNFNNYLKSLANYYRNRIDRVEEKEEKINICNNFLDTIQNYKVDLRDCVKNEELFFREIQLYKEQFLYYKERLNEESPLLVLSNKKERTEFSLKQQMLILYYLNILDNLNEISISQKDIITILKGLLNKDENNIKKELSHIHSLGKKGKEIVKTPQNLEVVKSFFSTLSLMPIVEKIEADISKIK